jgi:large subunit ribosomal protein L23
MGFLDRFKKQKEQELEGKAAPVVDVKEESVEEKPKTKAVKKTTEKIEKKAKPAPAKVSRKVIPNVLSEIIYHPLVTEKSAILASAGQYIFEINPRANRIQVANAIWAIYGVKPVKVQIQNVRREPVRFGRFSGKQKARKKAIVCLPKGKTINVHEGV